MTSRILVAMDESEVAEKALEYALDHHTGAEITVLHVVGTPSGMMGKAVGLSLSDDLDTDAKEHAHEVLDHAEEIAEEHGQTIEREVKLGHPARAIINEAESYDAVVIGTHGGSLADRLLVGNVAEKVFRRSPVPVTVVR